MKDSSGVVIYVGKAKKLMNRLRSYFGGGTITIPKVAAMVSHVADFEYVVVGTEEEADLIGTISRQWFFCEGNLESHIRNAQRDESALHLFFDGLC